MSTGTPFPHKNICGNGVPTRSRTTTPPANTFSRAAATRSLRFLPVAVMNAWLVCTVIGWCPRSGFYILLSSMQRGTTAPPRFGLRLLWQTVAHLGNCCCSCCKISKCVDYVFSFYDRGTVLRSAFPSFPRSCRLRSCRDWSGLEAWSVCLFICLSVCLFVQSFSQPSSIRFGSN